MTADQRLIDCESIVRSLASEPYPGDREMGDCMLCDAGGVGVDPEDPNVHDPTCEWRRAREFVAADPPPGRFISSDSKSTETGEG